jgi:polysaccharide biosynthesis transport protein
LNESFSYEPSLSDLVIKDPASGAHFIMAKPSLGHSRLLSSDITRLRHVIEAARQHYDLIVIDTPPSLAVIDPLLLSQMVDGMILVLPWRTISHRRAREAVQRLMGFACPLIGVVLSRVGGRARLGYGYHGYEPVK